MFTKKFRANLLGRDFVVGDLHGHFTLLQELLAHVSFDVEKDRLFSVGDLVDRGPENVKCLALLDEPWFHAVRGNHEEMMCGFFANEPTWKWMWGPNGGGWHNDEANAAETLNRLLPMADSLPFFITVGLPEGKKFHIVHANLDSNSVMDDNVLADEQWFVDNVLSMQCSEGPSTIWGRGIFMNIYGHKLSEHEITKFKRGLEMHHVLKVFGKDMSPVFCGHTPMGEPTQVGPMINIDTWAFAIDRKPTAGLTLAEPATNKFWTNFGSGNIKQVEKLVIV